MKQTGIMTTIFRIIGRILAFPFFLGIALVGYFIQLLKFMRNYILHGGEVIAYIEKEEPKKICDIYEKLTEFIKNQ